MEITVNEVIAEKIDISGKDTLLLGDTSKFSAVVFPQNTSYPEFQWSSSDENILKIDDEGNVKTINVGTAIISAIQKDITSSLSVEVLPVKVERIDINCDTISEEMIEIGETIQFHADTYPQNATYPTVSWSTSDSEIATIDTNGLLTALSSGDVIVYAKTADGAEQIFEITVAVEISPIAVGIVGTGIVTGSVGLILHKRKKHLKL